jgi:anhydro-N-acetylmuramic acid kinase
MYNYFDAEFDKDGTQGRKGNVNQSLLGQLNNLDFFRQLPPKSLGKEWAFENMVPLIETASIPKEDKLRTVYENIAIQIAQSINILPGTSILVTGGGAYNKYLLELVRAKTSKTIHLPDGLIIEFKEALIFAFLGLLRFLNVPNCLQAVTGAKKDNIGGIIHLVKD